MQIDNLLESNSTRNRDGNDEINILLIFCFIFILIVGLIVIFVPLSKYLFHLIYKLLRGKGGNLKSTDKFSAKEHQSKAFIDLHTFSLYGSPVFMKSETRKNLDSEKSSTQSRMQSESLSTPLTANTSESSEFFSENDRVKSILDGN